VKAGAGDPATTVAVFRVACVSRFDGAGPTPEPDGERPSRWQGALLGLNGAVIGHTSASSPLRIRATNSFHSACLSFTTF
jgi:hypothetical protein